MKISPPSITHKAINQETEPLLSKADLFSATQPWTASDVESWRASMQGIHDSCENLTISWRRKQLKSMRELITENKEDLVEALSQDLGKHEVEAFLCECLMIFQEISYLEANLKYLMKPQKIATPSGYTIACTWVEPRPLLGPAVLVIGPSNFPISLALLPAVGSLAAGNPTFIKPSEHCPASCRILAELIPKYFDSNVCRVVLGEADQTKLLLKYPWGKVFFTGSVAVGRAVAQQTALTLTPTVLELGGKCPCFVDGKTSDYFDWDLVASRIIYGKLFNTGQTCVSVDHLIVTKDVLGKLLPSLIKAVEMQYGTDPYVSELGRICTKPHASRLVQLIEEAENIAGQHAKDDTMKNPCKLIMGSSGQCRPEERYICPTIVLDPPLESRLMKEEVFGPILPILTVENREEALALMKKMETELGTPLCLFVFAGSKKVFSEVTNTCRSGMAMYNDCMLIAAHPLIPFGGLGKSGYGSYKGPYSFNLFSHSLPILHRPLIPGSDMNGFRNHPYGSGFKKKFLLSAADAPLVPVIPETVKWIVTISLAAALARFVAPAQTAKIARPLLFVIANVLEVVATYLRGAM